jgi:hypothetical protein
MIPRAPGPYCASVRIAECFAALKDGAKALRISPEELVPTITGQHYFDVAPSPSADEHRRKHRVVRERLTTCGDDVLNQGSCIGRRGMTHLLFQIERARICGGISRLIILPFKRACGSSCRVDAFPRWPQRAVNPRRTETSPGHVTHELLSDRRLTASPPHRSRYRHSCPVSWPKVEASGFDLIPDRLLPICAWLGI